MPDRASLLTAMIVERPVCLPCLSTKLETTQDGVEVELARLNRDLEIKLDPRGQCRICETEDTAVISLLRPM